MSGSNSALMYLYLMFVVFCPFAESFPNVEAMRDYVASGAGYLQGGLPLSIVKTTSKTAMHPGINFFIKHAGTIFRNLFQVALKDISELPETKHLFDICPGIESIVTNKFDDMVWELSKQAAGAIHLSIEPFYSSLDPNLPNFRPPERDTDEEDEEVDLKESILSKLKSFCRKKLDDVMTKQLLRERGRERASEKRRFLAEKRASMINEEETDEIIKSAFEYLLSLHEFIETILSFQTNHCLYNAFKEKLESFSRVVSDSSDWTEMLPSDNSLDTMIDELDDKIDGLKGSLDSVNKMQMKF